MTVDVAANITMDVRADFALLSRRGSIVEASARSGFPEDRLGRDDRGSFWERVKRGDMCGSSEADVGVLSARSARVGTP